MANRADFGIGVVAIAPSTPTAGTSLTLQTGQGSDMPATPFTATLAPPNTLSTKAVSEKVTVTDVTGDVLTITRGVSPTTAKAVGVGWILFNGIYKADLDEKADAAVLTAHTSDTNNPHSVTKAQVGLGNVDNTSDANKPVSTAQQAAINAATFINPYTVPFRNNAAAGPANDFIAVGQTSAPANSMVRRTSTGAVFTSTATDGNHAVNKSQMDTADALKVNRDGSNTMTGLLTSTLNDLAQNHTRLGKSVSYGLDENTNFALYNNTDATRMLTILNNGSGFHLGTTSTPGYLRGTGFPEGVISAPVGSIYIGTAVTNGASSWIKKSGTGNTGWKVLEGDTGWRDITTIFSTVTSGNIRIKREGSNVYIMFSDTVLGTNTGTVVIGSHITGFTPSRSSFNGLIVSNQAVGFKRLLASQAQIQIYGVVSGEAFNGQFIWNTAESYPTTLPGTAV